MDQIEQFVSDLNISNFVDQLGRERDAKNQSMLKRLLIEEENKFGATAERLNMVDRHIFDAAIRIARQKELVAQLKGKGRDPADAEKTLQTFEMILDLFHSFRSIIVENMNQRKR